MDEIKAKQQVVEKIKESTKILVTVSNSPSVDALSAALALTLLLDKQEKYATAIFSGETPPAIAFLEPEKTFDDTTDSLRDFIIALNKEKADHLRYKVEGESVKIFITPYKTTINENDLIFSQGDYNVELVIALGVDNQDHLDGALEKHGQILHDASIITMTAGDQTSDLGGTDWHDSNSSSLSEMVAGLAEALKVDKKKSLLDETIATALLTGVVAETDRFSNEHTTSKALTVAATLMSAGADQQLIANELQAARKIEVSTPDDEGAPVDSSDDSKEDSDDKNDDADSSDGSLTVKKEKDATQLEIHHDEETLADLDRRVLGDEKAKEKVTEEVAAIQEEAKAEEENESGVEPEADLSKGTNVATNLDDTRDETVEPVLGGTLNATAEIAAEDARRVAENEQNKTILSHSYLGGADANAPAANVGETVEGLSDAVHSAYALESHDSQPVAISAPSEPTGAFGGERVIQPLTTPVSDFGAAPAATPAPETTPFGPPVEQAPAPNPTPVDLGLPLPPPIPDFSQLNGPIGAPAIPLPPTQQPEILGDILAPEPSAFDTANAVAAPNTAYAAPEPQIDTSIPPLPPMNGDAYATQQAAPQFQPLAQPEPQPQQQAPAQSGPADPGQFQIPPQP